MIDLFINDPKPLNYSIKKPPKLDFLKRRYKEELKRVVEYYRTRESAVDNSHILNRIITTMDLPINIPDTLYHKLALAKAKYVTRSMGVADSSSKPELLKGKILSKNSNELLYTSMDDTMDLSSLDNIWENLEPVKVVYTDNTDLNFKIPDNKKEDFLNTYSVMHIEPVVLMLQYKKWANRRLINDQSTNPNVFIYQYVLPNMVGRIFDLSLVNRFFKLCENEDIDEFKNTHPFLVIDYSKGIDSELGTIKKYVYNQSKQIEEVLLHIPTFFHRNTMELLQVPFIILDRQTKPIYWVARVKYIVSIYNVLGKKGIKENRHDINRLPSLIKELDRSSLLDEMRNENFLLDLDIMSLLTINEKVGKR
jgi:hypothetical protein